MAGQAAPLGHASTHIVVRLRGPAHAAAERARGGNAKRDYDALPTQGAALQAEAARWRASRLRPMYDEEYGNPALAAKHGLDRTYILELPPFVDAEAVARAFSGLRADVEFATVDAYGGVAGFIPNDPFFSFQWGMNNTGQFIGTCSGGPNHASPCHTSANCAGSSCVGRSSTPDADINAPEAWELHTGLNAMAAQGADGALSGGGTLFESTSFDWTTLELDPFRDRVELLSGGTGSYKPGVYKIIPPITADSLTLNRSAGVDGAVNIPFRVGPVVVLALLDTGISTHSEFSGRILPGRNTYEIFNPTVTTDKCGHGSHVAGIAAASGHNGIGVAGVNWGARILPVKIFGLDSNLDCGTFTIASLSNGLTWAADNGADVANMSIQAAGLTQNQEIQLQSAVDYAAESGVLLIAATGNGAPNDGMDAVRFPAKSNKTLAIGGTNSSDQRASSTNAQFVSNYGAELDLMAPGDRVYSTYISNGYAMLPGTSMATPHVSGLATLLRSHLPQLTNRDIADILICTSQDLVSAGWDETTGFGRIDAFHALLMAESWPIIGSFPGNHAIDAAKPMESAGLDPIGWDQVEVFLPPGDAAGVTIESFTLNQKGADAGTAPMIVDVFPSGDDSVIVQFDSQIALQAWTTLIYERAGLVTLGFLPADVNGNRISTTDDALALVAGLTAIDAGEPGLPLWSADLDRSSMATPLDLLTCLDLLNGADLHTKWLDKTIPPPF